MGFMTIEPEPADHQQIDDAVVESYFGGSGGGAAAAMSMMAHGHNLPSRALGYRLRKELITIGGWLDMVDDSGSVLDLGCGAGAWVEIFAKRYKSVIGVERSPLMAEAAKKRVAHMPNAHILQGDTRKDLPEGPFKMIFLGGLCMYLNDADVVQLLRSLKRRLSEEGSIILRESTVRQGMLLAKGEYQAVYRSVALYGQLFEYAGFPHAGVVQNSAYSNLVMAEELVDFRRKWLPFLPKDSLLLGHLTWWGLRGITPISFWALPRILSALNIPWPRLQNHFFRLRLEPQNPWPRTPI